MVTTVQRFRLYQAPGAFGAEWVCGDENCRAPMVAAAQEGDDPGSDTEAEMRHAEGCRYATGAA